MSTHSELGEFLRNRRNALSPQDVGLPTTQRRRAVGLRREEVASLAGISTAWLVQLEQGRHVTPTASVVDALARALRLGPDERNHLRALVGLPLEVTTATERPAPALVTLLNGLSDVPACVLTVAFDYVIANPAYVSFFGFDPAGLPDGKRNGLWQVFRDDPVPRPLLSGGEHLAESVVAQFRYEMANRPDERRFGQVVTDLSACSTRFRKMWERRDVVRAAYQEIITFASAAGPIDMQPIQLRLLLQPHLILSCFVPVADADRALLRRTISEEAG